MKTKNEQLDEIEDCAMRGNTAMAILLLVKFLRNWIKEP